MIGRDWPVPFGLERSADPSGVSGTGTVATGVIWPDGRASMLWRGNTVPAGAPRPVRQLITWEAAEDVELVHGHRGASRLRRRDPAVPCADLGLAVFGIVAWYGAAARVTHWGCQWDNATTVTWRTDPASPPLIQQWPSGATAAFSELNDLDADEARLVWVPSEALLVDASTRGRDGRRWLTGPGYAPAAPPAARDRRRT